MIYVSKKEYLAILFAQEQVNEALEAAIDEDYINEANECLKRLNSLIRKYRKWYQK